MLMFSAHKTEDEGGRPSSSGTLVFLLVFVVCLVLFGGIAVYWIRQAHPELLSSPALTTPATTTAVSHEPTTLFSTNTRQSLVVYLTDDGGALQSATILLVQPDKDCLSCAGVPIELSLSEQDSTLGERYQQDGAEAATRLLQNRMSLWLPHYVVLSFSDIDALLTAFSDGLIYTVPENVSAVGANALHLSEGEQLLSPKQVSHLLQYTDWMGGRRAHATQHAAMLAAFCNQYLVSGRSGSEDFERIAAHSSGNITAEAFQNVSGPLAYLAGKNHGAICTVIETDGTFSGAGKELRFAPSDTFSVSVKSAN